MRIELKATRYEVLEDGTLRVYTNTEDFKAMLDEHSPNILIEYLNERWKPGIAPVKYRKGRKGGEQW